MGRIVVVVIDNGGVVILGVEAALMVERMVWFCKEECKGDVVVVDSISFSPASAFNTFVLFLNFWWWRCLQLDDECCGDVL